MYIRNRDQTGYCTALGTLKQADNIQGDPIVTINKTEPALKCSCGGLVNYLCIDVHQEQVSTCQHIALGCSYLRVVNLFTHSTPNHQQGMLTIQTIVWFVICTLNQPYTMSHCKIVVNSCKLVSHIYLSNSGTALCRKMSVMFSSIYYVATMQEPGEY